MKRTIFLWLLAIAACSCTKNETPAQEDSYFDGEGVFLVEEGNFNWGNGSVSFYSYDSSRLIKNIFQNANQRPLGDVPNFIAIAGDYAYIAVNNSGKIEVVRKSSFKSETTIPQIISPRIILPVTSKKAYISSLYSDSLVILDLENQKIKGYINIRRNSEAMVLKGSVAFVSSWYGGNEVLVIDTENDVMVDSITVDREPESMVIDSRSVLWVLCNGGWAREKNASLIAINSATYEIINRFDFPSILDSPTCLSINGTGDTIYFISNGVRRMAVDDTKLPDNDFIESKDHLFYKLGINPVTGDICVTDAVDYQQNGSLMIYDSKGVIVDSCSTGIIPGSMVFNLKP